MDEQPPAGVAAFFMTLSGHHGLRRASGILLSILGLAAIAAATLRSGDPAVLEAHGHWCVVCGSHGTVDVIQNLLLFAPLGAGLALIGVPLSAVLLAALAVSTTVELLQASVFVGRAATLSDVFTNSGGALLAALAVRAHRHWLRPDIPTAGALSLGWATLWILVSFASAWALLPAPLSGPYQVTQIPPGSGTLRAFEGVIQEAEIGGLVVTPGLSPADGPLARRLADWNPLAVSARVTPMSYAPGRMRPIVSLHSSDWESLMVLGQRERDLHFQLRLNARLARLRAPSVRLRGVFPATDAPPDARPRVIRLHGERAESRVKLESRSPVGTRAGEVSISPLHGWALLLPIALDDSRRTKWLSILWLAAWTLPAGYWAAAVVRGERNSYRSVIPAAGALVVTIAAPWLAARANGLASPGIEMVGVAIVTVLLSAAIYAATARFSRPQAKTVIEG